MPPQTGLVHQMISNPYALLSTGTTITALDLFVLDSILRAANHEPMWLLPAVAGIVVATIGLWRMLARSSGRRPATAGRENQLLLALRDLGGLTPVEAALETSLPVDEAEEVPSRLADRGHLLVERREGVLYYALSGRRHGPPGPHGGNAPR